MKSELTTDKNGNKKWKLPNGSIHREDGPAIEYGNGTKAWFINGKLHREEGPGIEWSGGGGKEWYLNSIEYTEQEHKYQMRSIKLDKLLK